MKKAISMQDLDLDKNSIPTNDFSAFLRKHVNDIEVHYTKYLSRTKLEQIIAHTSIEIITMPKSAFKLFEKHVESCYEKIERTSDSYILEIKNRKIAIIRELRSDKVGRPRELTGDEIAILHELKNSIPQTQIAHLLKKSESTINRYVKGSHFRNLSVEEKHEILEKRIQKKHHRKF